MCELAIENSIKHVSDTAHWIAAFRALESRKPDAVFKDPLAETLAGERGFAMVRETPHADAMAFAMTVRTSAIDRLVMHAIENGVRYVINLGAGLDTRPYRLQLPADTTWVEVDFPDMISYKEVLLKNETPVCKLQRIGADLSNVDERIALFRQLAAKTNNALVITEGVISYLANGVAAGLAVDLHAVEAFRYWIIDYSQGKMRRHKRAADLARKMKSTPFLFDVEWPLAFFGEKGWKVHENIHILDEADRIGRKLPLGFPLNIVVKLFPRKMRKIGNETYGFVMFER